MNKTLEEPQAEINVQIPKVPIRDCMPSISRYAENPADHYRELLLRFNGLMNVILPYGRVIMTDRPEIVRHITQKNHKNYIKSKFIRRRLASIIGKGMLTSNGPDWLKQRRAVQPGFHNKVLQSIAQRLNKVIKEFMHSEVDKYARTGEQFDMEEVMLQLTFKLITTSLFGQSLDESKMQDLYSAFSFGQSLLVKRIRKPYLKPVYWLTGKMRIGRRKREEARAILNELLEQSMKQNSEGSGVIEMILQSQEHSEYKLSHRELLEEVMVLYFAGHETTAIALSWAWYLIGSHPDIEHKLEEEARSILGDKDPEFTDLTKLTYTKQVLEETMRKYPPAWIIDREAVADDEINGIKIHKGQDIVCMIYGLHNNPEYWSDPHRFDPDRFSDENQSNFNSFAFIPFGAGPRMCIGKNLSLMEMQFTLSMLIKRYKFTLVEDHEVLKEPLVTLHPANGVMMTAAFR